MEKVNYVDFLFPSFTPFLFVSHTTQEKNVSVIFMAEILDIYFGKCPID